MDLSIWQSLKIDRELNSTASFVILAIYRVQHLFYMRSNHLLLKLLGGAKNIIYFMLGVDAQISYKAVLGNHIRLPHRAMGVVISPKAVIGDYVTIFHHVTIGVNEGKTKKIRQIEIGDNCYLSAGCCIISCKVSENCKIAPNAVVYKDIPSNTLVYANNEVKNLN